MAWHPFGNYRDPLRHQSQVYMNINFRTATRGKLLAPYIVLRWEVIPCLWVKRWANFPQAPQEQFSLSSRDVRGTLCFLSQVEWTPSSPDSKEGLISQKWLKFSLVFHLTRWRHVWIHCGDHRESHKCPIHLYRRPHIPLTPREVHKIQCFIRWWCLILGILISLWQLESEPRSPASPPEASVFFCQA